MQNCIIENNLFDYEKVNEIRLGHIPNEIIFHNNEKSIPLSEGDIIDENYRLTYNPEIIKHNSYYQLDFQYILKEKNYSEFYKYEDKDLHFGDENIDIEFNQLKYYGRTNLLKFKLCNDLCETCKTYGISNTNQQCLSCSSISDYNYFTDKPLNCLPEGYYQDNEAKNIFRCNDTKTKFYFDVERNKTICFKYDYECPFGYTNFNSSTNECLQTLVFNTVEYDLRDSNITNEEILSSIVHDMIENYNGKNNIIQAKDNFTFQVTSEENEMKSMKGITINKFNSSNIELGDCEKTLRENYVIDDNIPLILLKVEKESTIISEKDVQYEVYNSLTKERLDLSVCSHITITFPVELDDNQKELYEDLKKYGYDIFDINDRFYQDICSPYRTKDGTDMILSDRKKDIYNDNYSCPLNCTYSSYSIETGTLACNCSINNDNITLEDISNLVIHSFKNVFHTINYKFIKCYKLVFHKNVIIKNIGSILCLILFCCYLVVLIFYLINRIKSLVKSVDDFIKKKINVLNKKVSFNISNNVRKESNKSLQFKSTKNKLNDSIASQIVNQTPLISLIHVKKKDKKKDKDRYNDSKSEGANKKIKNKKSDIIPNKIFKRLKDKHKNKYKDTDIKSEGDNLKKRNKKTDISLKKQKRKKKYSDFELNNLKYEDAIAHDKRTFLEMYWSKLKRRHLILFTFVAKKDFNLIYVKISRFVLQVCNNMSMNALFFSDESMHKIYLSYGKYNFVQQIPQILYSSLISQLFDLLIGLLIITEKQVFEIICLKISEEEINQNEIDKIFRLIKIKFIIFYSISFLLIAFYWYLIAAFCAVYENTQITFIKDFISSFCTGLLYPFIIYLFLTFLRKMSLKDKNKKRLNFLYIIGK